MAILTLLDTEYLDEFDYGDLKFTPHCQSSHTEEPDFEETNTTKPNNGYTYRPMLEVLFPD